MFDGASTVNGHNQRDIENLRGLTPTLNIAHRGGVYLYPENTMYALESAQDNHGVDIIETDVHLTADGEVVIFHYDTLERTTDSCGIISECDWSDLVKLDARRRYHD